MRSERILSFLGEGVAVYQPVLECVVGGVAGWAGWTDGFVESVLVGVEGDVVAGSESGDEDLVGSGCDLIFGLLLQVGVRGSCALVGRWAVRDGFSDGRAGLRQRSGSRRCCISALRVFPWWDGVDRFVLPSGTVVWQESGEFFRRSAPVRPGNPLGDLGLEGDPFWMVGWAPQGFLHR